MIIMMCVAFSLLFVTPGWRRLSMKKRVRRGSVDQAVILDLAAAAIASGQSIPSTLMAVQRALNDPAIFSGSTGSLPRVSITSRAHAKTRRVRNRRYSDMHRNDKNLEQVAKTLLMGGSWEEAWDGVWRSYRRLGSTLGPAWRDGVAPVALLERGAKSLRMQRARHAKEAAAQLGTKLVVPLSMCFLPAFMLLGVVPVIVAAAGQLF